MIMGGIMGSLALERLAALFGSKARVLVLADLHEHSDQEVTASEVARRRGLTVPDAAKHLNTLEQIGLLHSHRRGRMRLYSLDQDFPLWPQLRSILLKTLGIAGRIKQALEGLPLEAAFIFGSVAAGEDTLASDVDLMVIGSVSMKRLSAVCDELEGALGREINPVLYRPAEYAARVESGDPFLGSVLRGPRLWVKGDESALPRLAGAATDTPT